MGRAVDMIHSACKDIIDNFTLIHNDFYMLHIFDKLRNELPEFKAFLEYEFESKKSAYVEEIKEKDRKEATAGNHFQRRQNCE